MIRAAAALLALAAATPVLAAATPDPVELTAPGPAGTLGGTLLDPDPTGPLLVILPGSGPVDRNGDSPGAAAGGAYRQLAEALAAKGIATLRIDKRGSYASAKAITGGAQVNTAAYADDAHAWSKVARARTGRRCVWLLGHSEGGLVALTAAQQPEGLRGIVLLATGGRPIGAVLREQLRANPANAPILAPALATVDSLEAGKTVDAATLPAPLDRIFAAAIQPYWIDLMSHDPVKLAAALTLPVLILQGDHDIQVSVADAQALKAAQPRAVLTLLPGVNHMLRSVTTEDRMANAATYTDAGLPISPSVAEAVAGFVKRPR